MSNARMLHFRHFFVLTQLALNCINSVILVVLTVEKQSNFCPNMPHQWRLVILHESEKQPKQPVPSQCYQ